MRRSVLFSFVAAAGLLLSACSTDAVSAPNMEAVMAKGGEAGGGAKTVKAGQIQRSTFGVTCPMGSSFSGQVDKGIKDRADITLVGVSTALTPTLTSLGGFWRFRIVDLDTGAQLLGMGTSMGDLTPSFQIKVSGSSTTPGSHNMEFRAWNTRVVDGVETIVEECSVPFALFAK